MRTRKKIVQNKFAVIDTETNWDNDVMSIGIVIAQDNLFEPIDTQYIVVEEAAKVGGMYSSPLFIKGLKTNIYSKKRAIIAIENYLLYHHVRSIFAYNASFDARCLPELYDYEWHDIINLAAYRQYNSYIPSDAECYSTGRMKNGYTVGDMLSMFGEKDCCEVHNALYDAIDELRIMKHLGYSISHYPAYAIDPPLGMEKKEFIMPELYEGLKVVHVDFGEGIVTKIGKIDITVKFDIGEKTFISDEKHDWNAFKRGLLQIIE